MEQKHVALNAIHDTENAFKIFYLYPNNERIKYLNRNAQNRKKTKLLCL